MKLNLSMFNLKSLTDGFNKIAKAADKDLPRLLAGGALVGLGITVGATAIGMHNADKKIAEEEQRRKDSLPLYDNKELTTGEKVGLAWPEFIPAAVAALTTGTLIVLSERKGYERYIAAVGVGELAKKALEERKEAEKDILNAEDVEKVDNRARQLTEERRALEIPGAPVTKTLYVESITKTPFYATENEVMHAFNWMNAKLNSEGKACIGDILEDLNVRSSPAAESFGWNSHYRFGDLVEPEFEPAHLDGEPDMPCTMILYTREPREGFGEDYCQL